MLALVVPCLASYSLLLDVPEQQQWRFEGAASSWSTQGAKMLLVLGTMSGMEQGDPAVMVQCNDAGRQDGTLPLAAVQSEGDDVPKGQCAVIASAHQAKDMDNMVAAFSQGGTITEAWTGSEVGGSITAPMMVSAMLLKSYPANGTMT